MQHLQPNTTLQGGKYRIERVLGQGGFGITYLATQLSLQRQVAIKEFFMKDFCSRDEMTQTMSTPSTGSNRLVEQYRKKFIKEARNLARLSHPNIISVIDVFEENDTVYYVMPYLSGGSLQDYVKTHGTLSEQEAMKYVKQIASALKYMHEKEHICHYDVKPANILLDEKGDAMLIDFGISKNYDAQGQETTTTPVGISEGYAPIEQYQQNVEEFSPVSDVYALGATLYFLLHGKRPVSAILRASGTTLLMSNLLSQEIKDIINASMKISKRERANSVDVFMSNINPFTYRGRAIAQDDDESTILDESHGTQTVGTTLKQPYETSNRSQTNNNNKSAIGWLLLVIIVIGFAIWLLIKPTSDTPLTDFNSNVETMVVNKPFILKGEIADNIRFTMHLTIKDNMVEGTEHYDSQKKDAVLQIKGIVDNDGTMSLDEYDGNVKTGSYRGKFNIDSYSGSFINKLGKEYIFSSIVMDEEDYTSKLKQKEQSTKGNFLSILNDYSINYKDDDWWISSYFLFDITKDGIPELWLLIKDSSEESVDVSIHVYSYDNRLIYKGVYGHPSHHYLCQGNGYIINVFAHQGYSSWDKYEYISGAIREKEIFSKSLSGDEDYKVPSEKQVTLYKLTNKQPIDNLHITK